MAAGIAAARVRGEWQGKVVFASAGTAAFEEVGAAPNATKVLAEIGIELSGHRTRLLTAEMVDEADLVVAMTEQHRADVFDLASGSVGKVIVLGELDCSRKSFDIEDPMGGGEEAYRRTRDEIAGLIPRLIDYLAEIFRIDK
jgi:protein-tyrosine-phosphatase